MSHVRWPPVLILLLAAATDVVIGLNAPLPVRAAVVLGFLVAGPGLAIVPLLRIRQVSVEITLVLALSLALDTLVAESLVLAQAWSAGLALAVLIAISVTGAVLQMLALGVVRREVEA